MDEMSGTAVISYEYMEKSVPTKWASMYLDCYEYFGWEENPHAAHLNVQGGAFPGGTKENAGSAPSRVNNTLLRLRRNRKLAHRMELERLQRKAEQFMSDILAADSSAKTVPTLIMWGVILLGLTAFAFDMLAITTTPESIARIVILCVLAVTCFIAGPLLSQTLLRSNRVKTDRKIDSISEEIYRICKESAELRKDKTA